MNLGTSSMPLGVTVVVPCVIVLAAGIRCFHLSLSWTVSTMIQSSYQHHPLARRLCMCSLCRPSVPRAETAEDLTIQGTAGFPGNANGFIQSRKLPHSRSASPRGRTLQPGRVAFRGGTDAVGDLPVTRLLQTEKHRKLL